MAETKTPEEMNEQELLRELLRMEKKNAKRMRAMLAAIVAIAVIFLVTAAILVPRASPE